MVSRNRHPEDDLQEACVTWFGYQHKNIALLLHHSPNGGFRQYTEAARFKAMGTRPGFPDLVLHIPRGCYHGLFLELKSEKGRLSDYQKEQLELLSANGYRCEVIRTKEEFIQIIEDYLSNEQRQEINYLPGGIGSRTYSGAENPAAPGSRGLSVSERPRSQKRPRKRVYDEPHNSADGREKEAERKEFFERLERWSAQGQ